MKTSKLRKPGLVLLVIGVVLLWFSGKDFLTSLKAPVDLNEAGFTADQVEEGMHVKTDIYAALDTFASEETWTENKDGSSTPKETAHQYYIIPVGEMEYMALEIGSSGSQFSTMSAIMDETYAYLTDAAADLGTTILPVEGTVEKLEGELDQYFGEWFTDTMFFGEEDPSPYLVHYMISPRISLRCASWLSPAWRQLPWAFCCWCSPSAGPARRLSRWRPWTSRPPALPLPGRLSPMIWATPLPAPIRPTETISIDVQAQGLPLGLFFPFLSQKGKNESVPQIPIEQKNNEKR